MTTLEMIEDEVLSIFATLCEESLVEVEKTIEPLYILAAPDLLEALIWYVENDDTNDTAHNEYYLKGVQRAKDAIAKATGE
jgi:hypothetical protein